MLTLHLHNFAHTVPAGSRIGMTAAFGEMNFPRESFVSMFEPPMTPTPGSAMAGRFHSMTPFQVSSRSRAMEL